VAKQQRRDCTIFSGICNEETARTRSPSLLFLSPALSVPDLLPGTALSRTTKEVASPSSSPLSLPLSSHPSPHPSSPLLFSLHSVRSSIDRDTKQFSKQTAVSSVSTITPSSSSASIHDIASMPIQPSYQPPSQPSTRTRSYGASAATPSSSNQPIKTNPQISIQRGRESKGEKQQPQAWIDSDPTSNDDPSLGGGLATTASSAYYNHSGKAKTRSALPKISSPH
jgi:hypothetical protein